MGLGLNNRVSIVVGRLIGKVTTNQIANLAGYPLLSYSWRKLGSVVLLRCRSSYLRLFAKSKAGTSWRDFVHPNGYLEVSGIFVSL